MTLKQLHNRFLLFYFRIENILRRFFRYKLRGYLVPRLFFGKEALRFPEGDKFTYGSNTMHSSSKDTIILFYNSMFGGSLFSDNPLLPEGCIITTDRRRFSEATAVVFHLPTLGFIGHLKKSPGQLWVAWTLECEANCPRWNTPEFIKHFDLKFSYHHDADVLTHYIFPGFEPPLDTPPRQKKEGNIVSFLSSNYNELSGRNRYVVELMKYLDVHSYGRCFRNRILPVDRDNRRGKIDKMATYKFNLAFENAVEEDYVTEKFFEPLAAGSVPVYIGAPNIEQYAPGNKCFINATQFNSPRELSEYLLWLDKDDAAYGEYFLWKRRPFRRSFMEVLDRQSEHTLVRLCRKVKEIRG